MNRRLLDYHWITPLAFLPFGLMVLVHRSLGLSDAMLGAPKPGQPHWLLFNVAMIVAFYLGIGVYLAHAFWCFGRGWIWVIVKCFVLVLAWAYLIVAIEYRSK